MEGNVQSGSVSKIGKAVNTLKLRKIIQTENRNNIAEEIRAAIEELESVRRFFDLAEEPELLDYAIYREKAALTRLSFLLRMAKGNIKKY